MNCFNGIWIGPQKSSRSRPRRWCWEIFLFPPNSFSPPGVDVKRVQSGIRRNVISFLTMPSLANPSRSELFGNPSTSEDPGAIDHGFQPRPSQEGMLTYLREIEFLFFFPSPFSLSSLKILIQLMQSTQTCQIILFILLSLVMCSLCHRIIRSEIDAMCVCVCACVCHFLS